MYLFGLEGSGFIISLGLTLLISGAIMYYCLNRFAMIENSIIEQGRILHSFINRMQQSNNLAAYVPTQLATNEAIKSANEQIQNRTFIEEDEDAYENIGKKFDEKIPVSDNSEDDSSDDEYSYSDSDHDNPSETKKIYNVISEQNADSTLNLLDLNNELDDNGDNNGNVNGNNKTDDNGNNGNNGVKIISVDDLQPVASEENILNIHDIDYDSSNESSSISDMDEITDLQDNDKNSIENSIKDEVKNEIGKGGITKMKVSELRLMALDKGLVQTMEAANKMKKDNLIKLLQDN